MVVQTFTIKEFQNYLNRLPSKLQKYSGDINQEIANSFVRRLKFNLHEVSNSSTGNLRKSFRSKADGNKGKIKIYGARYWKYLNEGRFPRVIPAQFIQQHIANPGIKGREVPNPQWIIPSNKINVGFVNKSEDSIKEDIPKIVERGLNKAFSK